MAEPNTIRRPAKPQPTYIGPVQEATGSLWHFPFYQPTANATTPIWFAQPTKTLATSLRNKLGKQPQAFLVSQELLEAIRLSITHASQTDPDLSDTHDMEEETV